MENNYSRGNDQWPCTLVKAHQLLIPCKSDKRRISPGLSAISYTTLDNRSQKKTSGRKRHHVTLIESSTSVTAKDTAP